MPLVRYPTNGAPKTAPDAFSNTIHILTICALSEGFRASAAHKGRRAPAGVHDATKWNKLTHSSAPI
eukprot:CAMPEP_0171309340 /NCGR_PEP_ID=MMETSP0816-20121228/19515_1 /TAXON_ID=420281 /ORGANISM="Proboscia inermis, Strain CCAP1064/1" /LENGTH=66 /DNA_ID=CAMNT_0011792821 /DNA_START=141 /DNA_END=341 /DNA_ORIENTATION=+